MDKKELLKMRLDGMSYRQIGDKMGLSRQRIQQLLSPPSSIRRYITKKANGRCELCGVLVGKAGHIHHRGDKSNGEDYDDIANLQLLCLSCHSREHMSTDEIKEKISRGVLNARKKRYEKDGSIFGIDYGPRKPKKK